MSGTGRSVVINTVIGGQDLLRRRRHREVTHLPVFSHAAAMTEDPLIIQWNIAHYQELLKLGMEAFGRGAIAC